MQEYRPPDATQIKKMLNYITVKISVKKFKFGSSFFSMRENAIFIQFLSKQQLTIIIIF